MLPLLHGLAGDILLFIPSTLWILLFLILGTLSLFRSVSVKRLSILCLAAALLLYLLGFHWSIDKPHSDGDVLRIVTSNRGQSKGTSIKQFIDRVGADVVVLQQESSTWSVDTRNQGESDQVWFFERLRPFALHSRFPIAEVEPLVDKSSKREQTLAARFILELNSGKRVAIYNVHFPSPRDLLQPLRGSFWKETLKGRGLFSGAYWADINAYADRREKVLQAVMSRLRNEDLPYVIAGDLNCPPGGSIHRAFSSVAIDAFADSGKGFGWTFPGKSRHALALYGPVLRIDYIFAGQGVAIHRAEVEADNPAQHRAVFGEFSF